MLGWRRASRRRNWMTWCVRQGGTRGSPAPARSRSAVGPAKRGPARPRQTGMVLTGRESEMEMSPAPHRLVWPVAAWPEIDQRLWRAGLDPGDGLDPTYAADLSQSTITNA